MQPKSAHADTTTGFVYTDQTSSLNRGACVLVGGPFLYSRTLTGYGPYVYLNKEQLVTWWIRVVDGSGNRVLDDTGQLSQWRQGAVMDITPGHWQQLEGESQYHVKFITTARSYSETSPVYIETFVAFYDMNGTYQGNYQDWITINYTLYNRTGWYYGYRVGCPPTA
jgi:hypothetical protein